MTAHRLLTLPGDDPEICHKSLHSVEHSAAGQGTKEPLHVIDECLVFVELL